MNSTNRPEKPFVFRFIEGQPTVLLELMNVTDANLKLVEILTVFLKDEETRGGGPSQVHIRFDGIKSMQPKERVVVIHRTWVNGKPSATEGDQLGRLKVIPGQVTPYVLDISWEDAAGKKGYQRVPVGH